MRRVVPAVPSRLLALPVAAVIALGAVACTPGGEAPGTPSPAPTPSASPTEAPSDAGPVLVPDGSAADNLPLFAQITQDVWATEQRAAGRAYIDALVAAGFDKAAMQVTYDETSIGDPVDSIQFAVRWDDEECLVGQVGPSIAEPAAMVLPVLGTERCLLGATRPIDW